MKKSFLIKFLIAISVPITSNAMDIQTWLLTKRAQIAHPSVQIFATLAPEYQKIFCHDYVFLTLLDDKKDIPLLASSWYHECDILNACFKEVTDPKPGDIVTYRASRMSHILHSGRVYDDPEYTLSKWGWALPHVFLHKTRDVLSRYGKVVTYYRLIKTKEEMHNYITQKMLQNHSLQNRSSIAQHKIVQIQTDLRLCVVMIVIIGLLLYR